MTALLVEQHGYPRLGPTPPVDRRATGSHPDQMPVRSDWAESVNVELRSVPVRG